MWEQFQELENHTHITFLHLIYFVGYKFGHFLIHFYQYSCYFVDLLEFVKNNLFQLLDCVRIEYDVQYITCFYFQFVAVSLECIYGVADA